MNSPPLVLAKYLSRVRCYSSWNLRRLPYTPFQLALHWDLLVESSPHRGISRTDLSRPVSIRPLSLRFNSRTCHSRCGRIVLITDEVSLCLSPCATTFARKPHVYSVWYSPTPVARGLERWLPILGHSSGCPWFCPRSFFRLSSPTGRSFPYMAVCLPEMVCAALTSRIRSQVTAGQMPGLESYVPSVVHPGLPRIIRWTGS